MSIADRVRSVTSFADRYQLGERIGSGGMGEVFRAVQKPLGRPVAVKFLSPAFAQDAQCRDRFLREARLASSLVHSNVVAVFEFGFAEEIPFLVTEFVDGRPLSCVMAQRREMGPREVLTIAYQVLDGLAAIHRVGIVHRDVKPENILVLAGEPLQVKIVDFGLAKRGSFDDGVHTAVGVILGTPSFMSPEQAMGTALSPATDLYCFSLILYILVVGHHPFSSAEGYHMIRRQMTEEPCIPEDLVPHLRQVLARGLAKSPAERFQSATEMRAEIGRLEPLCEALTGFRSAQAVGRIAPERPPAVQVRELTQVAPAAGRPRPPLDQTVQTIARSETPPVSERPARPRAPSAEDRREPAASKSFLWVGTALAAVALLALSFSLTGGRRPGQSASPARAPTLAWYGQICQLRERHDPALYRTLVDRLRDCSIGQEPALTDEVVRDVNVVLLDILEHELSKKLPAVALPDGAPLKTAEELFVKVAALLSAEPPAVVAASAAIQSFMRRVDDDTCDARHFYRGNSLDQLDAILQLAFSHGAEERVRAICYVQITAGLTDRLSLGDWARYMTGITLERAGTAVDVLSLPEAPKPPGDAWPSFRHWRELARRLGSLAKMLARPAGKGEKDSPKEQALFRQALLAAECVIRGWVKVEKRTWRRTWFVPTDVRVADLRDCLPQAVSERLVNLLSGDTSFSIATPKNMQWGDFVKTAVGLECNPSLIERVRKDGEERLLTP